jgi:hypothetical protein
MGSFMKITEFKREVQHRLPDISADLFGEPGHLLMPAESIFDSHSYLHMNAGDRHWLLDARTSGGPGIVAEVANRFTDTDPDDAIPILIVPYMSPAGARAARDFNLNWIDLSGNAFIRDRDLYIRVEGRPKIFNATGRPSSPFAPKSSRVSRILLLDPNRWWRQKDLAEYSGLDPGRISKIVKRLASAHLIQRDGAFLRPQDPYLLLDAWADDYRFDRHDIVLGHMTGTSIELAEKLHERLDRKNIHHVFTGLTAAWMIDPFARFRLNSVYVKGDPREVAEAVRLRPEERGANVQIIGPDDSGVFDGQRRIGTLPCASTVQVYLDLGHLPERAAEAAENLRSRGMLWSNAR